MSADSPMPQNATSRSPSEQEALRFQADFLWQALKETANLLMKAIAFFLAVAAGILGYVLSHPVANSVRNIACWTVITITVIFAMAVGFVSWGLWKGLRDLQHAQEGLSAATFAQLRLEKFFARFLFVFAAVIATTALILLVLLTMIARSLLG